MVPTLRTKRSSATDGDAKVAEPPVSLPDLQGRVFELFRSSYPAPLDASLSRKLAALFFPAADMRANVISDIRRHCSELVEQHNFAYRRPVGLIPSFLDQEGNCLARVPMGPSDILCFAGAGSKLNKDANLKATMGFCASMLRSEGDSSYRLFGLMSRGDLVTDYLDLASYLESPQSFYSPEAARVAEDLLVRRALESGSCKVTLMGFCLGAAFTRMMSNYMRERLEQLEFSPERRKEILRDVRVLAFAPPDITPMSEPQFSELAIVNVHDLIMRSYMNDETRREIDCADSRKLRVLPFGESQLVLINNFPSSSFRPPGREARIDAWLGHAYSGYFNRTFLSDTGMAVIRDFLSNR